MNATLAKSQFGFSILFRLLCLSSAFTATLGVAQGAEAAQAKAPISPSQPQNASPSAASRTARGLANPVPVPLWGRFETAVTNVRSYANPFADVTLNTTFTRPDNSRVSFGGFHDGDGNGGQIGHVWKLRFMPDQVGTWSYECAFSDRTPGTSGKFQCVAEGARPGPLRVDPANRHYWVFADGTRFWARPFTAPELFVAANEHHRQFWADYFFGAKHRFNLCNANLLNFVPVGGELNWQGTPYQAPDPARDGQFVTIRGNGLFPFIYSGSRVRFDGGSNVDWLRPSVPCWANADKVLGELEARRVVWFNHWGMIGWDWSGNGRLLVPPAARHPALRYWIARLAPYWNITLDLANLPPEFSLNAQWLDPRTGVRKPAGPVAGGAKRSFVCPDARDWALHLSGAKGGIKATVPAPLLGKAVNVTTPEPLRLHPDNPHYFLWKGKPAAKPTVQALAEVGKAYAVYVNGGTQAELDMEFPTGSYKATWISPRTGGVERSETFTHPGGTRTFVSPTYSEDMALRINLAE